MTTQDAVNVDLRALLAMDDRLAAAADLAGEIPLRARPSGLEGLAGIVVAQQVSKASADAIFARLAARVDLSDPRAFLAAGEESLRGAGLSRSKAVTLCGLAAALVSGELDLRALEDASAGDAVAALTVHRGVGVWTAECYLLFCAGHPDIFPAGDLALRAALVPALKLPERPAIAEAARIAGAWSPHRSVAARLLWAYYGRLERRDVMPAPVP